MADMSGVGANLLVMVISAPTESSRSMVSSSWRVTATLSGVPKCESRLMAQRRCTRNLTMWWLPCLWAETNEIMTRVYSAMMCGKMCRSVLADWVTVFTFAMRISLGDTFTILCYTLSNINCVLCMKE